MIQKFILLAMLSIISQFSEAQSNLTHLYLKIDGSDESNFKLEYGRIVYTSKYVPKRVADPAITSMNSFISVIYSTLDEPSTSDVLNIFIHGIWGDTKFAWEQMVQNISRDTYETNSNDQKVLLSIIWDSAIDYKKGVNIARRKGDYLGPFTRELLLTNECSYKINFLCHSMGNRVFQHMINENDLIELNTKLIDQFVSVGADIESNTFEEGEPLNGLDRIINDITIYVHNNDRTLGMSKLLNASYRLGLDGVPDITLLPENMRTIDVSLITDHDDLSSKIGNHRYFYTSPSIRHDLKRVLWDKDFLTSKKEMEHPRRLKLLPEINEKE
jgi:hypothetical protein